MLGYVRTDTPELRMREYERYRALYCGLCRHMGKCTGQCSRMTLSYDFVFLAAVRMSLLGEKLNVQKKRCFIHPFKKRPMIIDSETLAYCADASALLTYHKFADDLQDEHGMKRMCAQLSMFSFSDGYHRAKKRHPALDKAICEELQALSRYERDTTLPPSADAPAEYFGNLMARVFSEGLEGANARIAASIGSAIGRWIYLIDAADDYERDKKSGSFNPLLRLFGEELTEENRATLEIALKKILSDAECAFLLIDRFPDDDVKEILYNIMYLGLPHTAERILKQTAKGKANEHENTL